MKWSSVYLAFAIIGLCLFISCNQKPQTGRATHQRFKEEEIEEFDSPEAKDSLEFEKLKDPALGYVPAERMSRAIRLVESQKRLNRLNRMKSLPWTERGPISDTIGPSNGNTRAGKNSTSGFIMAVLVDTLNDPSGNTVLCGGTTGGLWKCTNFLSLVPDWQKIDDHNETLSITSICQDPTSPNVLYYSTGEPIYSTVEIYGAGIWKSIDAGNTWTKLSSTSNIIKSFKIVCDAMGNIYLAARTTTISVIQPFGLFRSTDHGINWNNITPANLTSDSSCTDIEISSTGRMHASFGWNKTKVNHWYTDIPSTATPTNGWNASSGIRSIASPPITLRMELACQGEVLYAVTVNSSNNADSCYKSVDGGVTWNKQNPIVYPVGVLNRQGYYNIILAINPSNSNEFIIGGLDLYKSVDGGQSVGSAISHWFGTIPPYVHADQHFCQWWNVGSESRILIGNDGGLFLSRDGGSTFMDRNKGLAIKQFYSADIHPDAGSPYLLAGAQDNGTHNLQDPGLGNSTEVLGGDGCFVHINQADPLIQFSCQPFNNYRRSTNGGQTWTRFNFSTSLGLFVNPYDYDDIQNTMYASYGNQRSPVGRIMRWKNANSNSSSTSFLNLSPLNGNASAFKVSPYTPNRVFIGSSRGKLLRLDNANNFAGSTVLTSDIADLTGSSFPTAFLNCINVGSSDQFLVAVFTNFGINNIWYSNNGGTSWTGIDGNLPDMPVRWALFDPQHDDKLYIATGAGVFYTDAVNGGSTQWVPETNMPTVRTDMLKIRLSDNTMVASTYGRGLFTTVIPVTPEVRFTSAGTTLNEALSSSIGCRNFKDYLVNISMLGTPSGNTTVNYTIRSGNTAQEGVDFYFTTNGDFSNISRQQVFQSGVAQTKSISVRIYDDAEIESQEFFTIDFSISGSTNATPGAMHSFTCFVNSDDIVPLHLITGNYSIGVSDRTLGTNVDAPIFDARVNAKRAEILYKASELTALGIGKGNITSLSFNLIKNSIRPFKNINIYIAPTNAQYLVDGSSIDPTSVNYKYLASYNTVNGLNTFILDVPFIWNGTSNIAIEICYDNGSTDYTDFADPITAYPDRAATQTQGNFYYQNGINCYTSFNNFIYYFNGVKPNLQFGYINNPVLVDSTLNSSRTEYLGPNADLYFYSSAGVLMGRVKNLTGFDYGCTQLVIDRAGNSSSPFWNNNPANYLLNKTFRVIPTNNNPAGQYEITLFYTQAEINGWQTATGNTWSNIKLVKVNGQISQVTPGSVNGAGNIVIIDNPVLGNFATDYTISATLSSGFSGFGAGIPGLVPLPLTLLSFTGHLEGSIGVLKWSTSHEVNTKNFYIEKSADGINFYAIGNVAAAGNSSVKRNYILSDVKLNEVNYYRLRMYDQDGRNTLSQIVVIRYNSSKQQVWVVNNPFNNYLDIGLSRQVKQLKVELISLLGSVISEKTFSNVSGHVHWQLDNNLSQGTYFFKATADNQIFSQKVIKN